MGCGDDVACVGASPAGIGLFSRRSSSRDVQSGSPRRLFHSRARSAEHLGERETTCAAGRVSRTKKRTVGRTDRRMCGCTDAQMATLLMVAWLAMCCLPALLRFSRHLLPVASLTPKVEPDMDRLSAGHPGINSRPAAQPNPGRPVASRNRRPSSRRRTALSLDGEGVSWQILQRNK